MLAIQPRQRCSAQQLQQQVEGGINAARLEARYLAFASLLSDPQRTTAPAATSARRQRHHGQVHHRDVAAVLLAIGCRLEIRCPAATPLLTLVHPHTSLLPELRSPEQVRLSPDRTYELLIDSAGNRWSRLIASAGVTTFSYEARIEQSSSSDPVVPTATARAVQALPVDTYPLLNPSPYCDTAALMTFAWDTFAAVPAGWGQVQAICDWVHEHIRFDYDAVTPEKSASDTLRDRAGVCRDFAHLAITICRCLNIPARYCTGYLGYTGIPLGEAPVDFSAWFEVFLENRWHIFDARHNIPRCGRVLIARGRDAADVPFLRSFGEHELVGFAVTTELAAAAPLLA